MTTLIILKMEDFKKIIRNFDWTNLVPVLFVISLVLLILLSITVGQMNASLSSLEDFVFNGLDDAIDAIDW